MTRFRKVSELELQALVIYIMDIHVMFIYIVCLYMCMTVITHFYCLHRFLLGGGGGGGRGIFFEKTHFETQVPVSCHSILRLRATILVIALLKLYKVYYVYQKMLPNENESY